MARTQTASLSMRSNGCVFCNSGCVYLEGAIVKEHHEGTVRLQPLQQVESGHVCICCSTEVPTLGNKKDKHLRIRQAST